MIFEDVTFLTNTQKRVLKLGVVGTSAPVFACPAPWSLSPPPFYVEFICPLSLINLTNLFKLAMTCEFLPLFLGFVIC